MESNEIPTYQTPQHNDARYHDVVSVVLTWVNISLSTCLGSSNTLARRRSRAICSCRKVSQHCSERSNSALPLPRARQAHRPAWLHTP